MHGVEIHDPYRWLEDETAPEVQAWVAAQQAHARAYLDSLPERPAIETRLREVMDVGALGPSRPRGRYWFFLRREPGANQACLWVAEGGRERVLADPNPLSADGATVFVTERAKKLAHGCAEGRRCAFQFAGDRTCIARLTCGTAILADKTR